jgi:predicted enzyme related to lactoylglutathione lyase
MNADQVLATVTVSDFAASSAWYARLFGRAPDHCPNASCAEWEIARSARIQVLPRESAVAEGCAKSLASVGIIVDDLDDVLSKLQGRHIDVAPPQTATHFLRFVPVSDPDGNLVTFVESLAG